MSSVFERTSHEVYLVSTMWQKERWGFVATWVFPVSLASDNKHFVVAISPISTTLPAIKASGWLGLQMLSLEQREHVIPFGCLSSKDIDKYAGLSLEQTRMPFLVGSVGWVEAKVIDIFVTHERELVYCRSETSWVQEPAKTPLRTSDLRAHLPASDLVTLEQKRQSLVQASHERFGAP